MAGHGVQHSSDLFATVSVDKLSNFIAEYW